MYDASTSRVHVRSVVEDREPLTPHGGPRGVKVDPRLILRKREDEQRAPLAGAEHPRQEPFRPGAPAGRHGDVLPSVDAVAARAAVVAAAALELPQQVARPGVEGVELTGGLTGEHEVAGGGQHR